jgi:nicotinamidase-related amidase
MSSVTSKEKNDPQGNVPDRSEVALLLIDVINDLEFEGGEELARRAVRMAESIAGLKRRARTAGIPVIYVNDNFGKWQSDFQKLVDRCLHQNVRGKSIVERLAPEPDDYFVLKPKHSGFHATPLDLLLRYLGSRVLILTGMAADNCILFTAGDAHMRDYHLVIPADCVESETEQRNYHALQIFREVLSANITPSVDLDLQALAKRNHPNREIST